MLDRDDDYLSALERAHQAHLDAGESLRVGRCAFWLGITLMLRGETGRATGWLGRAQRLLEREDHQCVERGYLLTPLMFKHEASGDYEAAIAVAGTSNSSWDGSSRTYAWAKGFGRGRGRKRRHVSRF